MKRIVALFMAAFMMLLTVPVTAHAASENVTMKVTADKSVAIQGETVNFTVSVGAVESLGGLEFTLNIPSGLTISESSVSIPDGLTTTLDSDGDIVKPAAINGYKWSYSAQSTGYAGASDLTILTFSCTVDDDSALEAKSVTLNVSTCFDNIDLDDHNVSVVPASVTVEKAPVYVTGVTLAPTSLTLKDGETADLTATVVPNDADNQAVTWSSNNPQVATVTNGTVTAVKEGTATITVMTVDGSKTATCAVTVTCNHALSQTAAKEPTCGVEGNIEYYTCSKCTKTFSDAAGTNEVTSITRPATGNHTEETRNAAAATEDAAGYTGDTYCSVCDTKLATGSVIPKLPHTHNMEHKDAVAPGCETTGTKEYYLCTKCTKKYADAAGTQELTDITVAATGHTMKDEWTYSAEGHWKDCENCTEKTEVVAHTLKWVVDTAATVDAPGAKHEECECGYKQNENTELPQLTHEHTDIVYHEETEATCTTEGNVAHWTCGHEDCAGKYYADEECQLETTDVTTPVVAENHVYDDEKDAICNECDYQRFYQVIEGADATYKKNSGNGLTIRVDGEFALFYSVKVDNNVVAASNYEVKEGSTIITFKDSYLSTLSSASHKVEVLYTDGKIATTQFVLQNEEVKPEEKPDNKPADNNANNNVNTDDSDEDDDKDEESEVIVNENTGSYPRSPKTGEPDFVTGFGCILACLGLMYVLSAKSKNVC